MKMIIHLPPILLRICLLVVLIFISSLLKSQTFHHYRGNLHAHSAYSDGNKDSTTSHVNSPAGCYDYAKGSKAFDFLGISEHNHFSGTENPGMHLEDYAKGLDQADDANDDGDFVCMYGMEYGTFAAGHVLIYGFDKLIGWEDDNHDVFNGKTDYKSLWQLVADKPKAFATLCHPKDADFQKLLTTPYNSIADDAICGVAIRNGPHTTKVKNYSAEGGSFYPYFKKMLAKGYHLGPMIDHDTHNTVFGRSHPSRTVVLAEELKRKDIMEAFREMRFYASEDSNATVEFTINGFPMGSIITGPVHEIEIEVVVTDKTNDKVKTIKVVTGRPGSNQDGTVLSGASVANVNTLHLTKTVPVTKAAYYYVEVVQKDGQKIYTSPIWINE